MNHSLNATPSILKVREHLAGSQSDSWAYFPSNHHSEGATVTRQFARPNVVTCWAICPLSSSPVQLLDELVLAYWLGLN